MTKEAYVDSMLDPLITGYAHLDREWAEGDASEVVTWHLLHTGQLGTRAPLICEQLNVSLCLLSQAASCFWGCRGGDHDVENLLRRVYNYAFSTLRLVSLGFYDEALGSLRGVAESANLLKLFCVERSSLHEWKLLPQRQREVKFKPVKVRERIETLGEQLVVDRYTYSALCETGVHITPEAAYSTHQFDGRVHVGGTFSPSGFLMIINELAIMMGPCLLFASILLEPEEGVRQNLKDAGDALQNVASSKVRATNYRDWLTRDAKFSRAAMRQLSEALKLDSGEDEFEIHFTSEPNSAEEHDYPVIYYQRSTQILKEVYSDGRAEVVFASVTDASIHIIAEDNDAIQGVLLHGATRM